MLTAQEYSQRTSSHDFTDGRISRDSAVAFSVDSRAVLMAPQVWHKLRPDAVRGVSRPYVTSRQSKKRRRTLPEDLCIENTPGLCAWLSAVHQRWYRCRLGQQAPSNGISADSAAQVRMPSPVPVLVPSGSSPGSQRSEEDTAPTSEPRSSGTDEQADPRSNCWSLVQWAEFVHRLALPAAPAIPEVSKATDTTGNCRGNSSAPERPPRTGPLACALSPGQLCVRRLMFVAPQPRRPESPSSLHHRQCALNRTESALLTRPTALLHAGA